MPAADPWGNAYEYRSPGKATDFELWSQGADGAEGGVVLAARNIVLGQRGTEAEPVGLGPVEHPDLDRRGVDRAAVHAVARDPEMRLVDLQTLGSPLDIRYATPNMVLPLRMVAAGIGDKVGISLWVFGRGRYEAANFANGTINQACWTSCSHAGNTSSP